MGPADDVQALRRRVKNSWLLDLHRWLGGLALVFTGVHVLAAILGDTYVHFGLASVLVPLAAHWHPVAVAWGVASLYLLAAVGADVAAPPAPEPPAVEAGAHPQLPAVRDAAPIHGMTRRHRRPHGRMAIITAGLHRASRLSR